ncbi:MAG: hypothetical protein RJB38_1892 [Pseudomonadota bacterium]|jgi:hypothetical protein
MSNLICWNCGNSLTVLDFGRQDTCRSCGRDTRTCRACIHYDSSAHNHCRENQADRVVEKERANFCDYFKPNPSLKASGASSKEALKAAAEALFRKKT